jgi:hypothetical protein
VKRPDAMLVAVAWGAVLALLTYAAMRVTERALFPEPNPAMLLWADHSPFTWRAAMALYFGGAGAFAGFAAAKRSGLAAARTLRLLVGVVIVACVVQGAVWP